MLVEIDCIALVSRLLISNQLNQLRLREAGSSSVEGVAFASSWLSRPLSHLN